MFRVWDEYLLVLLLCVGHGSKDACERSTGSLFINVSGPPLGSIRIAKIIVSAYHHYRLWSVYENSGYCDAAKSRWVHVVVNASCDSGDVDEVYSWESLTSPSSDDCDVYPTDCSFSLSTCLLSSGREGFANEKFAC